MARDDRNREHASFRPEDEIDELFGGANPNPERARCPDAGVLRDAGKKALPIGHPAYKHLTECSACYQEFRRYQQRVHSCRRLGAVVGIAAAVVVAVVGAGYLSRSLGVLPWTGDEATPGPQAVLLDYSKASPSRSEAGEPALPPAKLPRAILNATIVLPIGSEPGQYELRLVDRDGAARLERQSAAPLEDFAVRMKVTLDLRSFRPGTYSLELRRPGEDWNPHPVIIE
jgi:hypothetical protein